MVISLLAIAPTWSESESVAKPLTIYPKSLVSSLFSRQYFLFRPLPLKRSEPLRFFFFLFEAIGEQSDNVDPLFSSSIK